MSKIQSTAISPIQGDIFDDDEDGWQDMPVVREDVFLSGLDEEDQKKYHYVPSAKGAIAANARGNLIDVDGLGTAWRSKLDSDESEYTRLRVNEEEDADEVHLRTRYLFDEDKAMTPLSQMQATKNLLTEAQRIAYVGLCALTSREMAQSLTSVKRKELKASIQNMELWALKIMGRLYYHMELETQEQKMIESLAKHGVQAMDLVPSLMTTHTVANPEYDPAEARRQADKLEKELDDKDIIDSADSDSETSESTTVQSLPPPPASPAATAANPTTPTAPQHFQTTTKVLGQTSTAAIPGVSTELSAADEKVTLDIRWTVLCDLFLVLIADSVYDARSRVLLENVAAKLGLGWLDVVKFESRVTEALEIQEGVERMENQQIVAGQQKAQRKKRYMMLGLATLGGGLVIGLSAGLLAPVIGAGLGAAFTTIGITGTTGFLAGAGGAAVITTGGVLTGSGIAVHGMAKRTRLVGTFEILPLHNNKRVNCILTVPGFMNGIQDDVRLPFSVLDPIVGDVFSVLWEPEMIRETGSALKILTTEVLTQIGQTVLQATVMTALMSALQWPLILTKLGYLIDNPWSNALDRAKRAGAVLASVLVERSLGVRPISLIGFSLGARVIFYALIELAKQKAFGIVQDVFLLGATVTASNHTWLETRSVVSGRYVNAFARNDWVLNYLFRATSGGLNTVAGLRPVQDVPGLENVEVTDKIAGHMSYRAFMPLILDQLGFPVFADYFDEPEEPDFEEDRIVVQEEDEPKKKSWFSRNKKSSSTPPQKVSRPPTASSFEKLPRKSTSSTLDDDLPPRTEKNGTPPPPPPPPPIHLTETEMSESPERNDSRPDLPKRAGFDFDAIKEVLGKADLNPADRQVPQPHNRTALIHHAHPQRSVSAPRPLREEAPNTPTARSSLDAPSADGGGGGDNGIRGRSLSYNFARSVGLRDGHDGDGVYDDDDDDDDDGGERFSSFASRRFASAVPFDGGVDYDNDDNDASWSPASVINKADAFTRPVPLSFGDASGSIIPYGDASEPFAYGPPPNTPFGAISPPSQVSFSAVNDSLGIGLADPWGSRTLAEDKKKSVGFSANPWS